MTDTPSVILAVTDSQGFNVLGDSGDGFVDTPRIDGLAAEGVQFDNAYISSPVCTPSRAGLLTGRYPHNAGATMNNVPLYSTVRTMGAYFRRLGYETAYIGKWHLDGTDYFGTGEPPEEYPRSYWYDGRNYLEDLSPTERKWWRDGMAEQAAEYVPDAMAEMGVTREFTWAGRITDRAREFIAERADDDDPYFLVVSYDEPHEPSVCPPPFCEMYRDEPYPLPDNYADDMADKPALHQRQAREFASGEAFMDTLSEPNAESIRRPLYFGCSSFVDDEIGKVVDASDEHDDDTITVFTTDHGHHLGAHGLDGKGGTMYDEVTNVPFVFRAPGRIPEGVINESLASHVDLLPTLLAFAGADPPGVLDGVSLHETLLDPSVTPRSSVFMEYHGFRATGGRFYPIRALVTEEYKLVVNLFDTDELYHRRADPGEQTNLIDDPDHAARRDELHDRLVDEMGRSRDPYLADAWKQRPWRPGQSLTPQQTERHPNPTDWFLPTPASDLIPNE